MFYENIILCPFFINFLMEIFIFVLASFKLAPIIFTKEKNTKTFLLLDESGNVFFPLKEK